MRVRVRNDKDEDEDEDDVQDTIGFVGEVVEPMCDEDDRLARAALAERGDDVALGDGIQRGRRFVDDDESRRAMTEAHEHARAACTDGINGCTHARTHEKGGQISTYVARRCCSPPRKVDMLQHGSWRDGSRT